jgi:hypothetical protein
MPGVGNDQVIILNSELQSELAMEISDFMDEGWVLVGPVAVTPIHKIEASMPVVWLFMATMTKKRDRRGPLTMSYRLPETSEWTTREE